MTEKMEIADRTFESLSVGETVSFTLAIDTNMIEMFALLSGDYNPLHMDLEYARRTAFGRRIAHGQLIAAPISALAGHFLPGRRCLLLEVRSRFLSPVFADDRLVYHGKIAHISNATRAVKVQVEVLNQDGASVLRGSYEAQVIDVDGTGTAK